MGETSLTLVQNNYLYAKMLIDNGNEERERELEYDNILSDFKKRASPTHNWPTISIWPTCINCWSMATKTISQCKT